MPKSGVNDFFIIDQEGRTQRMNPLDTLVHELFHMAHPDASEEMTVDYTDQLLASNFIYQDGKLQIRGKYDNGFIPDEKISAQSPPPLPDLVKKQVSELNLPAAALEYKSSPEDRASYNGVQYIPPVTPRGYQPQSPSPARTP